MAGNPRNVLHKSRLAARTMGSPAERQGMAQLQHLGTDWEKKNLLPVWNFSILFTTTTLQLITALLNDSNWY